ncbi:MAG: serine hydrolase [Thermoanaerobaculia bacterium]
MPARLLVILVVSTLPAFASELDGRAALADFDAFLTKTIEEWNVPGLGLAAVVDGEVVFAEGVGYRDLEGEQLMTADTLFAIGSTTKAFTTTLLGMLVDEGRLDWDEPVATYLPGFELADPMAGERLTPRDLVTHRSGLPRHDLLWYNNNELSRAEVVDRLAYLEPSADLRVKYQYKNLMYLTAGHLIEVLTGGSWEDAVRTRLLGPLGMERTNFSVDASQEDADHALPYRENDDGELEEIPFRRVDLVGPAGSINSSVREMSRWLRFNLDGGEVGGKPLIEATTLAEIHSPQMTTGALPERPEISQSTYGLGWGIDSYRGHRRVQHTGGIDGFSTSVMLFPDNRIRLVAFTNRVSPLPAIVNQHAADLLLGLGPIDWKGEGLRRRAAELQAEAVGKEKRKALRVEGTSPSHPLEDYTGAYHHPGYGDLSISLADGELSMTYNDITAPLEHWHYDVWNGAETSGDTTFENMKLLFRTDLDGQIAAVEAPFEPQVDPIVFDKQLDARLVAPEHLRRFAGTYQLPTQQAKVSLSGNVLTLHLPAAGLHPRAQARRPVRAEGVFGHHGRVPRRRRGPGHRHHPLPAQRRLRRQAGRGVEPRNQTGARTG